MTIKREKPLTALVAAVLLVVLVVPFCPGFYNQHIFGLGRLEKGIREGDSFEDVHGKFVTYYEENRQQRPVQLARFESKTDLLRTREIPKATGLHIYDESAFDDVQLSVLFDGEGRVVEKLFVGD